LRRSRDLVWDGCLNVRDLGGHPTEDGGETRFGEIVRADSVRQLSEAGWTELVGYGVGRIVDLRWHEELEADPPRELPVEVVHVSLFGDYDPAVGRKMDALGDAQPDEVAATRAVYLEALARYRSRFAAAVAAVAGAPEGAVVVHCAAGKDRTGLVSALLLRLAGVSTRDIGIDYAESRRNLQDGLESWIEAAEDERHRRRRLRLAATPAEAMTEVVDEVERRYGGVHGYLMGCGVQTEALDCVRNRLRG
jgi:protein-tyrosine phosphatase